MFFFLPSIFLYFLFICLFFSLSLLSSFFCPTLQLLLCFFSSSLFFLVLTLLSFLPSLSHFFFLTFSFLRSLSFIFYLSFPLSLSSAPLPSFLLSYIGEPRVANITALTNVILMALDRQSFNSLLGPLKEVLNQNMILRVLNSLKWFENLSNNMKLRIARAFVPEAFEAGMLYIYYRIFITFTPPTFIPLLYFTELVCFTFNHVLLLLT